MALSKFVSGKYISLASRKSCRMLGGGASKALVSKFSVLGKADKSTCHLLLKKEGDLILP